MSSVKDFKIGDDVMYIGNITSDYYGVTGVVVSVSDDNYVSVCYTCEKSIKYWTIDEYNRTFKELPSSITKLTKLDKLLK